MKRARATDQASMFEPPPPPSTPGRTDAPDILEALEVDYTPSPVVVQLLLALNELAELGGDPGRCLAPAAGSGGWPRAMRAVFGRKPVIVGVEQRASELANLQAACDAALIGDFTAPETLGKWDGFGLVADNTPFSGFKSFWPGMLLDRGLLVPGAVVAFYGLSQWGQSAQAAASLARWSPGLQIRVGGRISHRGEGTTRWAKIPKKRRVKGGPTHELVKNGADAREYSLWVWRWDGGKPERLRWPEWRTVQLRELPPEMRTWEPSMVPGTYEIDPAQVAWIKDRYL